MGFGWGVVAGAALIGTGWWLVEKERDETIMFPQMMFYQGTDFIGFEGSLYGEGEDRPINSFYHVYCWQARMKCELINVDQIGDKHVGGIIEETIPVTSWTDREVIAGSEPIAVQNDTCNWYEIRIDRKAEEATYTRYPRDSEREICRTMQSDKVLRWRFENGRAHRQNADGSAREESG